MGELTVEAYRNFSRHKIEENNPGVLIVNWDYSSPVRISYEGHEYRAVCSKRELMKALGEAFFDSCRILEILILKNPDWVCYFVPVSWIPAEDVNYCDCTGMVLEMKRPRTINLIHPFNRSFDK